MRRWRLPLPRRLRYTPLDFLDVQTGEFGTHVWVGPLGLHLFWPPTGPGTGFDWMWRYWE